LLCFPRPSPNRIQDWFFKSSSGLIRAVRSIFGLGRMVTGKRGFAWGLGLAP
jgi:hypothetical protein